METVKTNNEIVAIYDYVHRDRSMLHLLFSYVQFVTLVSDVRAKWHWPLIIESIKRTDTDKNWNERARSILICKTRNVLIHKLLTLLISFKICTTIIIAIVSICIIKIHEVPKANYSQDNTTHKRIAYS